MPTTKSAIKRVKTSEQDRARNRSVKSGITTAKNKLYETVKAGDKAKSGKLFDAYSSLLDKAVKKGILKANAAGRRKSRAAARISAM